MTNNTLDVTAEKFKKLLDQSTALVLQQFSDLDEKKAYHQFPQEEVEAWFDEALPIEGMDMDSLLDEVNNRVLRTATNNLGPHMYAYVVTGGTQMSIIAEKLAATINQNIGKWHLGPAINEIEKRVIQWGGEMIGYGTSAAGVLVSGGSAANLAGLTIARNRIFEKYQIRKKGLFGNKPFIVYASTEVHNCVDKSMELLGLGTDNLRKIKTYSDFTIDVQALENQIKLDKLKGYLPFCIIGNAGTVNTGAIDDLDKLSIIAEKHKLWYHIDGAYGGLAASLERLKQMYRGIESADSIAIDFHKWLYQPFEAGCIMVKDWQTLRQTYFQKADYLDNDLEQDDRRLNFNEHHFQLSRNNKALKIWMSIKAYGASKIKAMIQKDIDLASYLADRIQESNDFELISRSSLAIVCFRFIGNLKSVAEIKNINQRLISALEKDGRVFITGTKLDNEFVLRACLINHRKSRRSTDYLLNVIRDVGEKII
jgi:glutamate/tyrosine decarboxylase-like PLP-dependent enzyme